MKNTLVVPFPINYLSLFLPSSFIPDHLLSILQLPIILLSLHERSSFTFKRTLNKYQSWICILRIASIYGHCGIILVEQKICNLFIRLLREFSRSVVSGDFIIYTSTALVKKKKHYCWCVSLFAARISLFPIYSINAQRTLIVPL